MTDEERAQAIYIRASALTTCEDTFYFEIVGAIAAALAAERERVKGRAASLVEKMAHGYSSATIAAAIRAIGNDDEAP